uniref:Metalloendopeptidase n=1 Tax=Oryzias melastigma TaxID=30732 RepID=G4Y363_ORYME|nr:hatching enzyme protease [Oryzias melastigma]
MDLLTKASVLLLLLLSISNAQTDEKEEVENKSSEEETDESELEDVSSTILRMNNKSLEELLEGDLVLPKTRNAMKCLGNPDSCHWPKSSNGIVKVPYEVSNDYEESEKETIRNAMKDFAAKTCVHFVPRNNERAYLSLEPRFGCKSMMGYVGDKQVVALQRFGCIKHGVIQHELLHALGFYHEHTRSDRDQHIKINWDNIIEYYTHNFDKMDTNNQGTPYDYGSIMHYGRTAFGKNRKETITPIPSANAAIGQTVGMSDIDILRVNKLYKCST